MHNTIKKAATAQTGESVQTDAVPAQPQPPTAPDGTASETASDVAGAEATTTKSQSIAATPDQLAKDQTNRVFRSRMTGGKTITNDQLHKEAVKLLLARQATGTETKAKATAKSYNQRRREATEKLRPLLKEIWAAFNRGETVGGFTSKETWAAGQSIGIRWVQKIIAAPKPRQPKPEANSVRLTDGMAVEYNGEKWCFDDGMLVKHCGEDKSDYSLMHAMDENHRTFCGIPRFVPVGGGVDKFNDRIKTGDIPTCRTCLFGAFKAARKEEAEIAAEKAVIHAGSRKRSRCGLRSTKKSPLVFVKDGETLTCAECVAEMNSEPSEEDKARLKKRIAGKKAKATREARLPQSEHYRAEDKGFGHWLVIERATGYRRDELFSSNRRECQERLEAMEGSLVAKAQRQYEDHELNKDELEMRRGQLAEGADGIGPLDDERRAEMVERIRDLEVWVKDYESKRPAKALAAAIDGATTCDNEVNSNEVV